MLSRLWLIFFSAISLVMVFSDAGAAATLLTTERAAQIVGLTNVATKNGEVMGEIVNHSKQALREVQLQIVYSWRWNDEKNPGVDDPGRAAYYLVDKEIAAGQSTGFSYKPSPPLPARKDGYFEISVKVVGFAQVYR